MAREYFWWNGERLKVDRDGFVFPKGFSAGMHVGPAYPQLGNSVQKHRYAARDGLRALSRAERRAYGAAVEKEIRALQRRELMAVFSNTEMPTVCCASGTNHNDKNKLHEALKGQVHGYQSRFHAWDPWSFARRPWQALYEATMAGRKVGHSINGRY